MGTAVQDALGVTLADLQMSTHAGETWGHLVRSSNIRWCRTVLGNRSGVPHWKACGKSKCAQLMCPTKKKHPLLLTLAMISFPFIF